jgi:hypothetical protein
MGGCSGTRRLQMAVKRIKSDKKIRSKQYLQEVLSIDVSKITNSDLKTVVEFLQAYFKK